MGAKARLSLAVILFACIVARAESVSQLHPSNYVNDFAHVLSAETTSELNDTCRQLDEKAKAKVAVVTINSLDGQDIEGYSVELFKEWGIGNKGENRGVLILLAVHDHKYRFEIGYGLEPILPDGKVGGFGREAVPFLKQGNYDSAVKLMTLRAAGVIAQDAGVQLTGAQAPAVPAQYPPVPSILSIIGAIILMGVPLAFLLWVQYRVRSSGGWGRGPWTGGGWTGGGFGGGGWGGGGFGGGGGSDFGGFGGGGMSGGGGASGGW